MNSTGIRIGANGASSRRHTCLGWRTWATIAAALSLFRGIGSAAGDPNPETNARLVTFQKFANGEVPILEAVVYRKITKPDGSYTNQEWWRFGCQENTWFVERLQPASDDPSKLVPVPNGAIVGASYTHFWTVSDRNIHVAAKEFGTGSKPDTYGGFHRNLMFAALSLGLPRRMDKLTLSESPVVWNGLEFRASVPAKADQAGASDSVVVAGKVTLGDDDRPKIAVWRGVGQSPERQVAYQYPPDGADIPSAFVAKHPGSDLVYRYEFLSLKLGSNDLSATDGYVPSMFADLKMARDVTVWTNDKPYGLYDGKLLPDFGFKVVGQESKSSGLIILIASAIATVIILALWYRRFEQKAKKQNQERRNEKRT